jgi:hypothetical protein
MNTTNERTPYILTLAVVAVTALAVLLVQPYSVPSPWQSYVQPARQYLQAALRGDSAALARQSVSGAPVAWALHAARTAPETLAIWAAVLRPATGRHWGDTTDVVFETSTEACEFRPILMRFVRTDGAARVLTATSRCFRAP